MKLDEAQIQQQLQHLQGWALDTAPLSICKTWRFDSFETAVKFFNDMAELAITHDHHPEVWSSYTQLRVRLWTHDAAGLTDKDFTLAQAIDQLSIAP